MSTAVQHHPASYRDPAGFIFLKNGKIYRQVNKVFGEDFNYFISSGLYEQLVNQQKLVAHRKLDENFTADPNWFVTLEPTPVPFITYPYEWSFDMLKDAALLTLDLLKQSIGYGLILKDATPYNIQWVHGKPLFIDTLSFEKYNEALPWIAYRQFCEAFLAPLLLMHYCKLSLAPMQLAYPEGIPLQIVRFLLPWRSKLSLHAYLHIHLHAKIAAGGQKAENKKTKFSKQKLLNLADSLCLLVNKLQIGKEKTTWSGYYAEAALRDNYLVEKKEIIDQWVKAIPGISTAIDAGANDGLFSRLLAEKGIYTIAADFDPAAINNLYNSIKSTGEQHIQPMIIDLANPSPGIGVNNTERSPFLDRIQTDLTLALAVIHHLVIGKNISFDTIAMMFHKMSKYLVIEFVPAEDEKVQLMLSGKSHPYEFYTRENFEAAFGKFFTTIRRQQVGASSRRLYLMQRHG